MRELEMVEHVVSYLRKEGYTIVQVNRARAQIIKESLLKEELAYCFQFAYYLWPGGGQYLISFEFPPDTNLAFKGIVEKIVSTLEKSCAFVMKRNGPLKSV